MGGVLLTALLGVTGQAHAQDRWAPLVEAAPSACRVDAAAAQLRIDCGGTALLVEVSAEEGEAALLAALERQLAPFRQAPDTTITAPQAQRCGVDGVVVDCLAAQVHIGGAVLQLLSGRRADEDAVGTCLYRGEGALPEVCAVLFAVEPH